MNLLRFLFYPILALTACGAETPVQMEAFRVTASDFYVDVEYTRDTQAIVEIRINSVMAGSGAERRGVRRGDRIVAIDGVPVATMTRSDVLRDGKLFAKEALSLEGNRGLLRTKWSLTVKLAPAKKKTPGTPVTTSAPADPPAP